MASIIAQRGKRMSKDVKFIGEPVTIFKLSTDDVKAIQDMARELEEQDTKARKTAEDAGIPYTDNSDSGLDLLKKVVSAGVEGGDQLTDEDFGGFPMDELSKLSGEIMKYSGIGTDAGKSD